MSLLPKRKTTSKGLAANQLNARKSKGAVTPEGRARAAAVNLRHGYYSRAAEAALTALGEDPRNTSAGWTRSSRPMNPPTPWR